MRYRLENETSFGPPMNSDTSVSIVFIFADDYRIFCGDLGNDVTDEVLARVFGKFPSFQKARVIRDRRSNKTKGFGFVSFKDPVDFTRAMKEMNGICFYIVVVYYHYVYWDIYCGFISTG